jgi:hypothetical protein
MDAELIARFWVKVDKSGECWEWRGTRSRDGYGYFCTGAGHRVRAHRLAFEMAFGWILPGYVVMHKCDNPGCVRPAHLLLGTNRDNVIDMQRKGRGSGNKPGHSGRIKLTAEQVMAIRARYAAGSSQAALAVEFKVGESNIASIVHGKTWRHLLPAG